MVGKTVPGRRVVVAAHDMLDQERKKLAADQRLPIPVEPDDMVKPETELVASIRELTYEQRLERQIQMLNLGMGKYERVLSAGGELSEDHEKKLLALIDSARKLELALAQIRAKSEGFGDADEIDLALGMIDNGMPAEKALSFFPHNQDLADQIQEALDARK